MAEDICDDFGIKLAQFWQLIGDKSADADVLKADGVQHPSLGFAHARSGVSQFGLDREPLDHDATEAVQIDQMGEFDPIAKCAAGGDDGVIELKGSDLDSQVHRRRTDTAGGPIRAVGMPCGVKRIGRTHRG